MGSSAKELAHNLVDYTEDKTVYKSSTDEDFFLITDGQLDYYVIDLTRTDLNEIQPIIKECEEVESQCWIPKEKFNKFIKKSDTLTYAVDNGMIVGFHLISFWFLDNHCIHSLDESMVLRRFQLNHVGFKLNILLMRLYYLRISKMRGVIRKVICLTETCSPRVMSSIYKKKKFLKFMDSSFDSSSKLLEVHDTYIERKDHTLVNNDYPFFIKSIFPGSLKQNEKHDNYKYPDGFTKIMPPGFNCLNKGDSFLLMIATGRLALWPMLGVFMFLNFGKNFLFNKKIGLLQFGLTRKNKDFSTNYFKSTFDNSNISCML